MELAVIFHPRVSFFFFFFFNCQLEAPPFQKLRTLASVLSPFQGRHLARLEPATGCAMDRFRRLGIFLVPVLKNWPPFSPPCPPAGGPAQMVLGGNLRSFPKPEMEADTYLGGGGRKSVLGWKPGIAKETGLVMATMGSGSWDGSSSAWCGLLASGPGCMVSHSHFPALLLSVSGQPIGKWVLAEILLQTTRGSNQGQARRNWFFQPKKQTKLLCGPFSLESRAG